MKAEFTDAGRPQIVAQATWKGDLRMVKKKILGTVAGSVLLAGSHNDFFVSVSRLDQLPPRDWC